MVLDAVSNFVRGETDAAVDNSQTTVSVVDASIFPDPSVQGEFNVVIWNAANFPRPDQDPDVEILRVTAADTTADELTVVRGQETTAAAAHPTGSAVHLTPTAKMFGDIEAEYTAQGENFDGEGTSAFSNLQSVSADELRTGAVTMYVRSDGSDTNDGLSETDAKATVLSALEDAPLNGDTTRYLSIDLGTGSFDAESLFQYPVPVSLSGVGQGDTVLVGDGGAGINLNQSIVHMGNLTIDAGTASQWVVTIQNGAAVRFDNVELFADSTGLEGMGVWGGSFCTHQGGRIEVPGRCLQVRGARHMSSGVTYDPGGEHGIVMETRETASNVVGDYEIIGGADILTGMDSQEFSYAQFRGDGDVTDVTQIMMARSSGFCELHGTVTKTDVNWEGRAYDGGVFTDQDITVGSVSRSGSTPTNIRETGGEIYFDKTADEWRGYNGTGWVAFDTTAI